MGSLESTIPLKKGSLFGKKEKHPFSQRFRSSFSRLLFNKKLDYIQWICAVVVFLCLVVVFQMFLPVSVVEDSEESFRAVKMRSWNTLHHSDEEYVLDIGEDVAVFLPRISEKFKDFNLLNRTGKRFGYRKPQLALSPYNPYNPYIPGAMVGVDGSYGGGQSYYTLPNYQNPAYDPLVQLDNFPDSSANSVFGASGSVSRSDGRGLKQKFNEASGNFSRNSLKLSTNQTSSEAMVSEGPRANNGRKQDLTHANVSGSRSLNAASSAVHQGMDWNNQERREEAIVVLLFC